jgi:hypothetical protein
MMTFERLCTTVSHKALKTGQCSKKPHWGRDSLILSLSGVHEGSVGLCPGVQKQLPKSCWEVNGVEEWPISPMHSLTYFMEYLSVWVLAFKVHKS